MKTVGNTFETIWQFFLFIYSERFIETHLTNYNVKQQQDSYLHNHGSPQEEKKKKEKS